MITDIVKIGNSKGIRIPAYILKECNINDKIELEIQDGKIIITPIKHPRKDWETAFKKMHANGDDRLIIDDDIDSHLEDWKWS